MGSVEFGSRNAEKNIVEWGHEKAKRRVHSVDENVRASSIYGGAFFCWIAQTNLLTWLLKSDVLDITLRLN
jgi:hypothetical protein